MKGQEQKNKYGQVSVLNLINSLWPSPGDYCSYMDTSRLSNAVTFKRSSVRKTTTLSMTAKPYCYSMHHAKLQRVSVMHWSMQKYFYLIFLPLTMTNRVPNTRWMESFILSLLLLVAFFSYQTDRNMLFIYSLKSSVYAHSGHVLFFWLCFCIGFTVARSRVQQKVVMRRWVKGQTRVQASRSATTEMSQRAVSSSSGWPTALFLFWSS